MIVPLLATLKYEVHRPTGSGGITSVAEHYATVVALAFDDNGLHFEYVTLKGGRVPDHRAIAVTPLRPRR